MQQVLSISMKQITLSSQGLAAVNWKLKLKVWKAHWTGLVVSGSGGLVWGFHGSSCWVALLWLWSCRIIPCLCNEDFFGPPCSIF